MDPIQAQETSERDQLWASLRLLQSEIDRLAGGDFDGSERQNKLIGVLAQIVTAEIKFRDRESVSE